MNYGLLKGRIGSIKLKNHSKIKIIKQIKIKTNSYTNKARIKKTGKIKRHFRTINTLVNISSCNPHLKKIKHLLTK